MISDRFSARNRKPLFDCTSDDEPKILHISFAEDPSAPLGAELVNFDQNDPKEMFIPGFALVGRLLPGQTVARKCGVMVGDCIVAVNGQGVRRFPVDYEESGAEILTPNIDVEMNNNVVPQGGAYDVLLAKIKHFKLNGPDPPLVITLERYGWDARANAWPRFLEARNGNVPEAMQLIQDHEAWKAVTFPIDLTYPGLQKILQEKAISILDMGMGKSVPPTVYINYGALQQMQYDGIINLGDIVHAFVVFTELLLSKLNDPRHPKTNQLIDLSGVTITSGFRVETLKTVYRVFERNYPETLNRLVMFPVSSMVGMTARSLLGFVSEKTQAKFVITNSLETVCENLNWKIEMVESAGGLHEFVQSLARVEDSMLFHEAGGLSGGGGFDGAGSSAAGLSGSDAVADTGAVSARGLIQGHLHGTGVILKRWEENNALMYQVRVTHDLLKYIIPGGLAFVDRVSVNVVEHSAQEGGWFTFRLDEFVQQNIDLPGKDEGSRVNIEVDVLGKYWENDMKTILEKMKSLESKVESLEREVSELKGEQTTEVTNVDLGE